MPAVDTTQRASRARLTVAVAVAVLAGLVTRLVLLHSSLGALDSDEAVVGLMARQFQAGHFQAFYWQQAYSGTLEPALTAVVFELFGPRTWAVKSVPLVLSAVAACLLWRVGRRLTSPVAAAVAALAVWIWPANYLWWSLKSRGYYQATLCLGLAVLLIALRIGQDDERSRWWDWAALGLAAGVGWWQGPQIAYFAVPTAAWLLWRLRRRAWRAIAAVPAFALGALPWLVANAASGLASLKPPPAPLKGGYLSHLGVLAAEAFPMTLGVKVMYTHRWISPAALTVSFFAAAIAALVMGLVRRWSGGGLALLLLAMFPFLYALLPLANTVAEGRYTMFMWPVIALVIAHGTVRGRRPRLVGPAALLAGCAVITGLGIASMGGHTSPYFSGRRVPASLAPLEGALRSHGTTRVWTNYWVAYRITFESGEHVIAAPVADDRHAPFAREVAAATPPAAHVFPTGSREDRAFRAGLDVRGIAYGSYHVGDQWTVYEPAVPVGPDAIPGAQP